MLEQIFPGGLEPLLFAMAQRFAAESAEREVELLTSARAALTRVDSDPRRGELFCLSVLLPEPALLQMGPELRQDLERRLLHCARQLLPGALQPKLASVSLGPLLTAERDWRARARAWLKVPAEREAADARRAQHVHPSQWREVEVQLRTEVPEPERPERQGPAGERPARAGAETQRAREAERAARYKELRLKEGR